MKWIVTGAAGFICFETPPAVLLSRAAGRPPRNPPRPCSKGAADQYVLDYARIYGLRTVSLRQSCIYGPRQFGIEDQGWLAWFAVSALAGAPVTVFGDGRQVRDALEVGDLIDCYRRCAS